MSASLLATKFYIPPPREDVVTRPRLTEKVLAGANRPQTFTLLSGPAGSGKTTLLSQFVTHFRQPVAWLSLDEADDDPIRFWTYLLAACQSVLEGVGESALALLETAQALPDDTVPTLLINELAGQETALVLLLDDFHVIHNPSIHAGFSFLLDHLPGNLHVVVSTRVDPPWPLSRYRARNQLVEIRARDLRFSREEAAEFLRRATDLNLSAEDVAALEARIEGWAAGLQLAAIALQSPQSSGLPQSPQSPGLPPSTREGSAGSDASAFVKAFTGSQLYVAEYLVEEVLRRQPEDVQTFLLETSILRRLKAGLCDAVTGRQDGREMLGTLHRANLFLIPLDAVGHWFRYHHLFADLLQARLRQTSPSEAIVALHLRAADWYEQTGFDAEAVDHALEANDSERVASLVDRAGQRLIFTDQYATLTSWLNVLPLESFQTHPRLEIYRVLLALTKGTLDMSERTLLEKEKLIKALPPSPENDRLRVEAMVYLALFLAFQNASRAIQIAQEALLEIPEDALKRRAYLFSALYRAHGMAGDVDKAERAYVESLRLAQAAGHYGMASNTTMIRAFDLCQYGRLDEALSYCQLIVDAGSRLQRKVFHDAGPAYIGLAGIHLERYHLQTAEDYLRQGMELCRQGGMYGLFTAYVQKARLHQAKGEFEKALAELRVLEQTLQRREFTLMIRQVSLRLAMADVDTTSAWVAPLLEMLGESPYARKLPLIAVEAFKLSLARIYLAQGEIERANLTLDQIQATVEPGKRFGRLMEVHLLRALALQKQEAGDISSQAITYLERALDLAQPAGFVLLLVEEGPALIPLLQAVVNRRPTPDRLKQYAQKLLNAFSGHAKPTAPQAPSEAAGLVESLTPREMEVLQLIAAGHSNQDIADRLFITVRTVKKHAGNIYGKLNVSRRTEAVARARELGLLPTDG